MKPDRIILIRHGKCHANTDESKFATEPDYTIELTENGILQALEADLFGCNGFYPVPSQQCLYLRFFSPEAFVEDIRIFSTAFR